MESLQKEKLTEKMSSDGQAEVRADKLGFVQAARSAPFAGVPAWSIA